MYLFLDVLNQKPAHHGSSGARRARRGGGYDAARVSTEQPKKFSAARTGKVVICIVLSHPLIICFNTLSREMHERTVLLNLRKRFERQLIYVSI